MIKTPCIGVCSSTLGDNVCRGCKRFNFEAVEWNGYTDEQKSNVLARTDLFMTNIARHFFYVDNIELFKDALKHHNIVFREDRCVSRWIFDLLRTSTLFDPQVFHLTVNAPYHRVTLSKLKTLMEDWLYNDSVLAFEQHVGRKNVKT